MMKITRDVRDAFYQASHAKARWKLVHLNGAHIEKVDSIEAVNNQYIRIRSGECIVEINSLFVDRLSVQYLDREFELHEVFRFRDEEAK